MKNVFEYDNKSFFHFLSSCTICFVHHHRRRRSRRRTSFVAIAVVGVYTFTIIIFSLRFFFRFSRSLFFFFFWFVLSFYLHRQNRRGQSPCAETIFRLASFIHFFSPYPPLPSHERASKRARNVRNTHITHKHIIYTHQPSYIEWRLYEAYLKHKTHNDIIIIICSIWMSGVANKDMSCY